MENKLKYTTLFCLLLFCCNTNLVLAQNIDLVKGDNSYKNANFKDAAYFYTNSLKKDNSIDTRRKLAICYKNLNQYNKAIENLSVVIKSSQATADDILTYANIFNIMGKSKTAKIWYQKYAKINPNNPTVKNILQAYNLIAEQKKSLQYLAKPIAINSPQTDFASAFYKNGILLVSGRKNTTSKIANKETGDYYFDMYFAEKKGDDFLPAKPFSPVFNTKNHEGPACFTGNQRFIYFTRNKGKLDLDGKSELNIYSARHGKNGWEKPELFLFSKYNFSIAHPCISPNGKRFFFISNREGGYGGTDIYYCQKQGFSWSAPINLGPLVNTAKNEMFPYITDDNILYFSSDGHIGYGGLDIYRTSFEQNRWTFPVNLGIPFNSENDDFSYIADNHKDYGLFSSNRTGNDDVFMFQPNPVQLQTLTGNIVEQKTKKPISSVNILLMNKILKENVGSSDENGDFKFRVFRNAKYSLIVSKPGFKTKRILYFPSNDSIPRKLKIRMQSTPWEKLSACVTNKTSNQGIRNAEVELINTVYKISKTSVTDKYGEFSLDIDPSKSYTIIVRKPTYFTKIIKNFRFNKDKFENFELERYSRKKNIALNNINFKKDDYILSDSDKKELDNMIQILNNNPNISITIVGYTKHDLGKKRNITVASKRAEQAAKYILSTNITPNRVKIKSGGYDVAKADLVVKLFPAF